MNPQDDRPHTIDVMGRRGVLPSFVEGSTASKPRTSRFTQRGVGFLRTVLKFIVAAVKIKLGPIRRAARDLLFSPDPDFSQKRRPTISSAAASQKRAQTKVRAMGSPNPKVEFDTERISTISIGRTRFYPIFRPDELR